MTRSLPAHDQWRPSRKENLVNAAAGVTLRTLPRIPETVKRLLLGGRTVSVDGNTLDTTLQLMLAGQKLTGIDGLVNADDVAAARGQLETLAAGFKQNIPVASATELSIPGPAGEIRARHYRPVDDEGALLVFFHGGGQVIGSIDTHDDLCREICQRGHMHVLSVDYRLAPEHPAPAGTDDAYAAFRWAREHAAELGADPERVAVGGDSAGGNQATLIAHRARTDGPQPALQFLLYPVVNYRDTTKSQVLFSEGYFLTRDDIDWFRDKYLSGGVDSGDPRVSPLLADGSVRPVSGADHHRRFRPAARRRQAVRRGHAGGRGAGRSPRIRVVDPRLRELLPVRRGQRHRDGRGDLGAEGPSGPRLTGWGNRAGTLTCVATKPKKTPRYDLKAADRKRNLAVQIGLTAVVAIFAVALVFYIVMTKEDKPGEGETRAVRVASSNVMTKEGTSEPKAVLSLYEDFLCPACGNFEKQFGPTINRLIDSGAVAVDYNMVSILDRAGQGYSTRAANAGYCVADADTEAFRRFHGALFAQQPAEGVGPFPDNARLIEVARQAGVTGEVPACINGGRYNDMVKGLPKASGVNSTPTIRINGEDYSPSTPDALIAEIEKIVGDVPALDAGAPPPNAEPTQPARP